jgi:hypothetical protein
MALHFLPLLIAMLALLAVRWRAKTKRKNAVNWIKGNKDSRKDTFDCCIHAHAVKCKVAKLEGRI